MPWMTQISQEKVELSAVLRLEKYKTGDTRFLSISRIKDKEEFSILKEDQRRIPVKYHIKHKSPENFCVHQN